MKQKIMKNKKLSFNRVIGCLLGSLLIFFITGCRVDDSNVIPVKEVLLPDWIDSKIIEIDDASRRSYKLDAVNDIVIHYIGNPQTTALENYNYFASPRSVVSSHFLIGLEGEVIQCIPLDEWSSASNWRNNDTISIEVCHPDETGEFLDATYDALVQLTSWLCDAYNLDTEQIIRHYDITGKDCPRYFVRNEDEWVTFKNNVKEYLEINHF